MIKDRYRPYGEVNRLPGGKVRKDDSTFVSEGQELTAEEMEEMIKQQRTEPR